MRQQKMRKQQRLRVLQVRHARHGHAHGALGESGERLNQPATRRAQSPATASFTNSRKSVATSSLRLRAVCSLNPSGPSRSTSAISTK